MAEAPVGRAAPARRPVSGGIRLLLWAVLALVPLLAAAAMVAGRMGEEAGIARAAALLERGEPEAALAALRPIRRNPFLASPSRRRAAELLLRLGEDRRALALLAPERFDAADPADRRIRELTGRCQRAATLLGRADASRDPRERVRLAQEAHAELPDAPRVLERLVQEELLALTRSGDAKLIEAFEQDYLELRKKAPGLAAGLKDRVAALLASEQQ